VGCAAALKPAHRLPEMLSGRFGALETVANASIKLAGVAPEEELAMELIVAEAISEFAVDQRPATRLAANGAQSRCSPVPIS
jgi:hypothetical protein